MPRSGVGAGGMCVPQPYPEVVWAWGSLAHSWVSQACRQDWGHRDFVHGVYELRAGRGRAGDASSVPWVGASATRCRSPETWLGAGALPPLPLAGGCHCWAQRCHEDGSTVPCPLRDPRGGGTLGSTRCVFDGEGGRWALRCCPAQLPPVLTPAGSGSVGTALPGAGPAGGAAPPRSSPCPSPPAASNPSSPALPARTFAPSKHDCPWASFHYPCHH